MLNKKLIAFMATIIFSFSSLTVNAAEINNVPQLYLNQEELYNYIRSTYTYLDESGVQYFVNFWIGQQQNVANGLGFYNELGLYVSSPGCLSYDEEEDIWYVTIGLIEDDNFMVGDTMVTALDSVKCVITHEQAQALQDGTLTLDALKKYVGYKDGQKGNCNRPNVFLPSNYKSNKRYLFK